MELNHTHDASRHSWLASANIAGNDFPLQNLPCAVFRRRSGAEAFRGGVAIGDQVIDLAALSAAGLLTGLAAQATAACAQNTLNAFMAMGPAAWQALRHSLFECLESAAPTGVVTVLQDCLVPQEAAEYAVPAQIGDYTDFFTSLDHARNVGRLLGLQDPVSPNFRWLPVAYHGRVSSIGVSGQKFRRPMGQAMPPGAALPVYGPCARLDYELELGIYIGQGNAAGEPVTLDNAEQHLFGVCLLNDWSARDIQFWEMNPLGPFLGKNFATTVSPWIVSMEALAPYRLPWQRPAEDPQPLAYLESAGNRARGALDIRLEVAIESAARRQLGAGPVRISQTSFRHQYWTVAQMLAHHTMGGCNMRTGDLIGSGTISGPAAGEAGAIIELTQAGREPITLAGGPAPDEQRQFLLDGDAVILRGFCKKPGYAHLGFGECRGEVLPALT